MRDYSLNEALLPEGWTHKDTHTGNSPLICLIDPQGLPRVEVTITGTMHDYSDEVKILNIEEERKKLEEKKFATLLKSHNIAISTTAGTGARGQTYIDTAYQELMEFTDEHPEFKSKLPQKGYSSDDGLNGIGVGLANVAADLRRQNDDCPIQ